MSKEGLVNGGLKGGKYFGNEPWMYTMLGLSREEVVEMIKKELENGIARDYSDDIADKIADEVAQDVCDTADVENWSMGDLRLGIGRTIKKGLTWTKSMN